MVSDRFAFETFPAAQKNCQSARNLRGVQPTPMHQLKVATQNVLNFKTATKPKYISPERDVATHIDSYILQGMFEQLPYAKKNIFFLHQILAMLTFAIPCT